MDRVLLIIDDIQYSRHVEMTLRKVGFELESINNEFSINDSLLSFNPDYIICRGHSNRLATLNVGKKLKDLGSKSNAKVILIFPENFKISPDELLKIKMDLLLFEPLSTLRLAVHLFAFSGGDVEFIKDKLLKFAITDTQFRNYEQIILRNAGLTIDSEIQLVSNMTQLAPAQKASPLVEEGQKSQFGGVNVIEGESLSPDFVITQEAIRGIHEELKASEQELPLRIDTYNRLINKVDQDLKQGLKKRQTKQASSQLRKDLIKEKKTDIKSERELDDERIRFTQALFKKS